jgi:hypothetical protein
MKQTFTLKKGKITFEGDRIIFPTMQKDKGGGQSFLQDCG